MHKRAASRGFPFAECKVIIKTESRRGGKLCFVFALLADPESSTWEQPGRVRSWNRLLELRSHPHIVNVMFPLANTRNPRPEG